MALLLLLLLLLLDDSDVATGRPTPTCCSFMSASLRSAACFISVMFRSNTRQVCSFWKKRSRSEMPVLAKMAEDMAAQRLARLSVAGAWGRFRPTSRVAGPRGLLLASGFCWRARPEWGEDGRARPRVSMSKFAWAAEAKFCVCGGGVEASGWAMCGQINSGRGSYLAKAGAAHQQQMLQDQGLLDGATELGVVQGVGLTLEGLLPDPFLDPGDKVVLLLCGCVVVGRKVSWDGVLLVSCERSTYLNALFQVLHQGRLTRRVAFAHEEHAQQVLVAKEELFTNVGRLALLLLRELVVLLDGHLWHAGTREGGFDE